MLQSLGSRKNFNVFSTCSLLPFCSCLGCIWFKVHMEKLINDKFVYGES